MVNNRVQFAVVREDPRIEAELVSLAGLKSRVFLIGSGGCTAFSLSSQFPEVSISVLDPNPMQIDLIRKKLSSLSLTDSAAKKTAFGIGTEEQETLTSCGNFESMFRSFRNFIFEFVCDREEWLKLFTKEEFNLDLKGQVFNSKFWPVAFQLFFSDSLLVAMFGKGAIQYAPFGSYPNYFKRILEDGLLRKDAKSNYFLHHIFLGHYLDRPDCLPTYLSRPFPADRKFEYIESSAQNAPNFEHFDIVSLSNIFDWMDPAEINLLTARLSREMKPGSWLVYRQLNNQSDLRASLVPHFAFNDKLAKNLHAEDRSLFYSSLHIGRKI